MNPEELRDIFAVSALQGILARTNNPAEFTAHEAYQYADAMLKAREENKPKV